MYTNDNYKISSVVSRCMHFVSYFCTFIAAILKFKFGLLIFMKFNTIGLKIYVMLCRSQENGTMINETYKFLSTAVLDSFYISKNPNKVCIYNTQIYRHFVQFVCLSINIIKYSSTE